MAQFVMIVTVGNSDSDVNTDIQEVASVLNHIMDHEYYWDRSNDVWPVTVQPLSEVIPA